MKASLGGTPHTRVWCSGMMLTPAAEVDESASEARRPTQVQQPVAPKPATQQSARDVKLPSDWVVATRTQFQITFSPGGGANAVLPGDVSAASPVLPDPRGWSSPHGEPYRPLGKPDLRLKFTPRLADGSNLLQNAQRMRVFEGNKQHHSGSPGGPGALKDKEMREATATGGKDSSQDKPALFDLFPFNVGNNNRKRTLDERQVRFAYRLQESMTNYSPEKVRNLQRRPGAGSPSRVEQQSGDTQQQGNGNSFEMLKEALHECSSRLRLVRNGASLLCQLPTDDIPVLHELQCDYLKERARVLESRATRSPTSRLGSARNGQPILVSAGEDRGMASGRAIGAYAESSRGLGVRSSSDEETCYLPYTTRHLQPSPHRHLSSLDELRAKLRKEKHQLPVRTLRNSYDATGQQMNRRPSGRPSRVNSTITGGRRPSLLREPHELDSPLASRPSLLGEDTGHGGVASIHRPSHAHVISVVRTGSPGKNGERVSTGSKAQQQSPTRLHSIERLQAAVNAIEEVKVKQSALLAQSIESLNQDRRDCIALKIKSFNVENHVDDDLVAMRKRSEMQRVRHIEQTVESIHWYEELLRKLLAREGTGAPPHPAELFVVTATRRLAHEGHKFTIPLLFQLIQRIHVDDFALNEVQDMLIYLRDVLAVPPDVWTSFFSDHGFQLPIEASERKAAEPEPTLHRLGSRLRAVVKVSQLLRHMSEKG